MKKIILYSAIATLLFTCCLLPNVSKAQYTKLYDFQGNSDGNSPRGDLFFDGTFLYGMTAQGGLNNSGTIFKIKSDGTGYAKLFDFAGTASGKYPNGSLISDGTFLYGMTSAGGMNNLGTVFKIMPDGTGYIKLLDFAGITNGSNPQGSLISDGNFLYGMTIVGGTNSFGTIFKIKPDGTGYVKLLDFSGTANGSNPHGDLISDGTFLYGMTAEGGPNSFGVIFKIKPDGTSYSLLTDFTNVIDGGAPWGSLISDGTFLYGMTQEGGTNTYSGVIFKIKPDGTGYVKLFDFDGAYGINPGPTGADPLGSLFFDGTFLYGTTQNGGISGFFGAGEIFKIKPDGTEYNQLLYFAGLADGRYPCGSLISDGTFLYGMTKEGGTSNNCTGGCGTIFKYNPNCTLITANTTATNICEGESITLTGGGATSYAWSGGVIDGVDFVPTTTTTYSVTGTGGNSCSNTATKTITVNPLPAIIANTTGSNVCTGTSVTLTGGGASSYVWTGGITDGGSFVPSSSLTYTVTGTDGNSCSNTATETITVNPLPIIAANATDTIVCAGTSVTLTGGGASSYVWTGGITNGGVFFPSSTLTYTVIGTDGNSCSNTATKTITVNPLPTIIVNATYSTVCTGNSVTLTGGGATSYLWSGGVTDGVSFVPISTLTYTVSGTDGNNCSNTATKTITILPPISSIQTPNVCAGQSIMVAGHIYTISGTYTDTLASDQGCDSTVTTNLTINSVDTSVSVSNPTLTATATGATYQWIDCSNGNSPIAGQTTQSFTATANGSYAVIVSKNSCSDTSSCHTIYIAGIVENNLAASINIYPNPFTSQTTITFPQEQKNTNLQITDVLGKEIKIINFTGKQLIIEKGEMDAGTYFLRVKTEQEIVSKKIIINK